MFFCQLHADGILSLDTPLASVMPELQRVRCKGSYGARVTPRAILSGNIALNDNRILRDCGVPPGLGLGCSSRSGILLPRFNTLCTTQSTSFSLQAPQVRCATQHSNAKTCCSTSAPPRHRSWFGKSPCHVGCRCGVPLQPHRTSPLPFSLRLPNISCSLHNTANSTPRAHILKKLFVKRCLSLRSATELGMPQHHETRTIYSINPLDNPHCIRGSRSQCPLVPSKITAHRCSMEV